MTLIISGVVPALKEEITQLKGKITLLEKSNQQLKEENESLKKKTKPKEQPITDTAKNEEPIQNG